MSTYALRRGDHVLVAVRTSGGSEQWAGVVVDTDHLGQAHIVGTDERRRTTAAVKGATWVHAVHHDDAWEAFTDAHAWDLPQPHAAQT